MSQSNDVAAQRAEKILSLLRQADRLEAFPRTGYVLSRVPMPESIAAHAYGVCLASLTLCDAILERDEPPKIDRAMVMEMAILHDLSEAVTTDIPAPVKRYMGRDVIHAAELEAARGLLSPVSGRYVEVLERYEKTECLESKIVHAADKIQMMIKVLQYEAAGVGDVRRFWVHESNFRDYGIPEARLIFARIRKFHEEGNWPIGDFD